MTQITESRNQTKLEQDVAPDAHDQSIPERRHSSRKSTDLTGVYSHMLDSEQTGTMMVENLSPGGCGIRILTPHGLKRGDMIRLEFKLDDRFGTFIRIHGQLRWVLYDLAGIQFQSPHGVPQVLAYYIGA